MQAELEHISRKNIFSLLESVFFSYQSIIKATLRSAGLIALKLNLGFIIFRLSVLFIIVSQTRLKNPTTDPIEFL